MESTTDDDMSAPGLAPDHPDLAPEYSDLPPGHAGLAPEHPELASEEHPGLAPDHSEFAPDHPALAPEHSDFAAQVVRGPKYGRAVRHVTGGGPIKYGEAVQFEFEFADGSREKFHSACDEFPRIVSDLKGYAGIAERARRATPDRPMEVVNPYQATEARTDRVGPMIVVRFPTTDGLPVLIAMETAIAEKLVLGLERELARPMRR
jgi:hypothetical protein